MKSEIKATSILLIFILSFFILRTYDYYKEFKFAMLVSENRFKYSNDFYFQKDGVIIKENNKNNGKEENQDYLKLALRYSDLHIAGKDIRDWNSFKLKNNYFDVSISFEIKNDSLVIDNYIINHHLKELCTDSN